MNPNVLITSFLLVVSFHTFADCKQASLDGIRQKMPYSEARSILLDNGWQALLNNIQSIDVSNRVRMMYNDNGWHEIDDCSGVELGFCSFQYRDAYENQLYVTTIGECYYVNTPKLEDEKCELDVIFWSVKENLGKTNENEQ